MKRLSLVLAGMLLFAVGAGLFWTFSAESPPEPVRPSRAFAVRSVLTLEEVERQSGVPVEHLIRELHLPDNVPTDVPLRRLVIDLGLDMTEVRRVVRDYMKSHRAR